MRAVVVHNESAGSGNIEPDEVRQALIRRGCMVSYRAIDDERWVDEARDADVVVAAGGDGTVASVFIALAGATVPILVLPIGTANNIARTIGASTDDPLSELELRASGAPARFSVPLLTIDGVTSRFVESVGGGVFADLLDDETERDTDGEGTDGGSRRLHRIIDRARSIGWNIEVDGQDASGDYVAVEAMNIKETGPNVALAPDADPADSAIDLVLVTADDVARLHELIHDHGSEAIETAPRFRTIRGRTIRLRANTYAHLRVDDELRQPTGAGLRCVTIEVDGVGVNVLRGLP